MKSFEAELMTMMRAGFTPASFAQSIASADVNGVGFGLALVGKTLRAYISSETRKRSCFSQNRPCRKCIC